MSAISRLRVAGWMPFAGDFELGPEIGAQLLAVLRPGLRGAETGQEQPGPHAQSLQQLAQQHDQLGIRLGLRRADFSGDCRIGLGIPCRVEAGARLAAFLPAMRGQYPEIAMSALHPTARPPDKPLVA